MLKCHITEVSRLRAKIKGDLPRVNRIDYETGIANVEPLKCKLQVVCGQEGFHKTLAQNGCYQIWDRSSVGRKGDL